MEAATHTRLPSSIFFFLVAVGAVQVSSYAARMPQPLASHFRSGGLPNGWETKAGFLGIELSVAVMATVIAFGLPRILGAVPVALLHVQNKEYWFGPARQANTLAFFRAQFAWFGCVLLTFLLFVNELLFRANLASSHQLNTTAFAAAMAVFLCFVVIWTVRLIRHFSKVP
jgi:uncharacterized membrane protein